MNALDESKAQLMPLMESLVEYLSQAGDTLAVGFFAEIYGMLGSVEAEEELLEVCLALSTSAFQGFAFDPYAALLLDELLARAEQLAFTFSANESAPN